MDWVEMTVETTSLGAEAVSALMMDAGALGTQVIDRADVPGPEALRATWALMDEEILRGMPEHALVKAWFQEEAQVARAEEAVRNLKATADYDAGSLTVSRALAPDEAWAESWKKHFHPMAVGRFVIKPSWEDYAAKPGELVIGLDPGMAFGTGWHETTRLCLLMIEGRYRGGRALDIGTGSGILALAMGKLGAPEVLAVDIDRGAVRAARENAAANGLAGVIRVMEGDLTRGIRGPFAFACANILADAVIMLSEPLKPLLLPGGVLIASGIVSERGQDVEDAFVKAGWKGIDRKREGEWLALAFEA